MPVGIEQNIVQFQITIDHSVLVQELQGYRDLGCIESTRRRIRVTHEPFADRPLPCARFRQLPLPLHVVHEIASGDEFDDEEESRRRLKARMQTDEKRMIGRLLEDVLLALDPVDVFVVVHDRLFDHFHRVETRRLMRVPKMPWTILGEKDLGIRTAPDDFEQFEILQTDHRRTGRSALHSVG